MCSFGRFSCPLGLNLLGGKALSFLHHLLSLLVPLPLLVNKVRLGSLSRGKGGGLGLNVLFGHIASSRSKRLDLLLCCITIALGTVESS